MDSMITDYLKRYIDVSPALGKELKEANLIRSYTKGTIILREGEEHFSTYFVLKGCLRSFTIRDGEDITIDFFLDEDPVLPIETIASFNLETLENSILLVSNERIEKEITSNFPQLKELCLSMSEMLSSKLQREFSIFKTRTPEERYLWLLNEKPEILQRAPQYKVASYLGIKRESLSRIKKRILS